MNCHTCGGKGHFKRDCPNRKVMIINEDNEYETGDDVDPNAPEDDDYDTDGEDAYPSDARTIVVSQRALNVLPSASTQRCNLFQTKALVGPDKACKWLSDNGEMKVNHMVRVEFEIGPYKDSINFDVVPMTEFGAVFPEEEPVGLPPLRGIEHQIDLIPGASLPNRTPYRTNPEETKEIHKQESHAGGLMGHFGREKTLLMLADHFYWPKMRRDVDRYEEGASIARGGEEQLDKKMDVKLDMELDKKTSHGRAREEREACARGGDVQTGAQPGQPAMTPGRLAPGPVGPGPTPDQPGPNRVPRLCQPGVSSKPGRPLGHPVPSRSGPEPVPARSTGPEAAESESVSTRSILGRLRFWGAHGRTLPDVIDGIHNGAPMLEMTSSPPPSPRARWQLRRTNSSSSHTSSSRPARSAPSSHRVMPYNVTKREVEEDPEYAMSPMIRRRGGGITIREPPSLFRNRR
ncbi:hypothetical protein QYE76_069256 [Lolium multiflorum]|uniref:CCHC-type domain-containing protein n=1 Tax=Lolium multiflorum TaxID=4521 RepID=A0AAD8WCF9_LOLMU|nr:hypothetical protein QYE76_069256 [Lolium multiflorum]